MERLAAEYADTTTALRFADTFQLLIAVMLSAQTTDARVNRITPALFADFPTAQAFAAASPERLSPYIASCGLYVTKSKNIVAAARIIVERYGGQVPRTLEELTALPGVGRKTANVLLSVAFGVDAIAVDTHVFRVANRLGLARAKTPQEAERQLMRTIPQKWWSSAHHWLIHHGRAVCVARNPRCACCVVDDLCPSAKRFLRLYARRSSGRSAG